MKYQSTVKENFIFNSAYQIVRIMIPIITTPYLSRIIGAKGVGTYAYASSVAAYFMLFIKLGLGNYGNRTIAFVRNNKRELSRTFWSLYVVQFLSLIIFLMAYLFYCFMIAEEELVAILMVPYVISSGLDISWFFFGLEQFKTTAIRDLIIKMVSTLAIFLLVKREEDVWVYTLIISVSFLSSQIALWILLHKYVEMVIPSKADIIKHIKPNLILFIPSVAVSLYKIMDKIMLGLLSMKTEVGLYESSEKIIQVPTALIDAWGSVMLPRISNIVKTKRICRAELFNTFRKSIWLVMLISSSLCFGIMSVAEEFVPIFYGQGFEKCVILYYWLLPSCLFLAFANVIRTQYLIPWEKERIYIVSLFAGAIVNIIFNFILIPFFGSIGAAIGTLLAEVSVCICQMAAVKSELPMKRFIKDAVPFLLSGIGMFIFSQFMEVPLTNALLNIFIKIVVCGCIYIFLLILFLWLAGLYSEFKRNIFKSDNEEAR